MGMFTLTKADKTVLVNRLKSLAWRAGMMLGALVVDELAKSLHLFNLTPTMVVIVGLVLGELSKFFNSNIAALRAEKARQEVTPPPQE